MQPDALHQNPKRQRGANPNPKRQRGASSLCGYSAILLAVLATLWRPVYVGAEPQAPARGQRETDFQKLLADKAPAIVTVKFVLKVESSWGQSENEGEATGVMIEPHGLVLCANTELGGGTWFRRAGGRAVPTDIKVLIGDDTDGLDARLIARDSELDLTWIRIKDPGNKKFACIDLKEAAAARIGERLYFVTRLGKYFDRVPVVHEGRVGGLTRKPRKLYVPSGGAGGLGLPVFNADGRVIGVSISQMPAPEEAEGAGFVGYGGYGLILPTAEVVKATKRAKQLPQSHESAESAQPQEGSGPPGD